MAVDDRLALASGAPDGFAAATEAVLQSLSRLSGGQASVVDGTDCVRLYLLSCGHGQDRRRAWVGSRGRIQGCRCVASRQGDQPVGADQCRDLMQTVLKVGGIGFDGGKAELTEDSEGILDRASAVIARCPDAGVEVGAHSDSDGSAARNRDLTQARAETIVDIWWRPASSANASRRWVRRDQADCRQRNRGGQGRQPAYRVHLHRAGGLTAMLYVIAAYWPSCYRGADRRRHWLVVPGPARR